MTEQQKALKQARKQYGDTAFTEDHIDYRRVGFRGTNGSYITGMGDNWHDAFVQLAYKTNELQQKGII